MHEVADEADGGGLIAYGPKVEAMFRRGAHYVDRVLKGARPAEMPIEQPTQFELVVNRRSATLSASRSRRRSSCAPTG